MDESEHEDLLNEIINRFKSVAGIDLVYFLGINNQIIKECNFSQSNNYLEPVLNIIGLAQNSSKISNAFYSEDFHTYTLLNEAGLLVISKLDNFTSLHIVIVAGENQPVDLINLLKICKEARLMFQTNSNQQSVFSTPAES